MKTTLFRNLLATLVALFAALLALPQPVQAQTKNTITIDGVKKEILSTDFQKDPNDKHGFMVFFFLSEDKNEFLGIMGNEKLHAFYDSFSLDRYESKHPGKSYWGIAYQRKGKILFQSSGHPDLGRVHFRRGELRIDGHPRPDRSVCSFQLRDGEITDAKHGDGKKHTLSIDYRHDREAPTAGKLNVGTVDKTSISLSWTPATDKVTPADKMHYVVEYQRMGGHGWMMLPVKNATSYTIKELTPNTEYNVNICALDESGNYIRYDEQTITTKSETTIYDLKIAGTEVTSANCNDLSVIDGVSGTVTYDPDTKTLTLDNATIKTTDIKSWGHCISNQIDGLNIHLIGNNAFSSEQSGLIYNDDDKQMTFTGEGKLTLSSGLTVPEGFRYGIRNRGHILVKNCHLEISTEGSALLRGAWEFDNCHVRAKGNAEGSIVHLKAEPTFKECSITRPQNTVWKSVDAEYFLQDADGKNVTDWVTIEPTTVYNLKIAGTEVTSANCKDLSVIDGVSGTVTYDPDTKTLTLDNATIKTTETKSWGHCISNQIDGLNIHLIGNNAFTSEQSGLIYNDDDKQMTFTGEGKLTLSSGLTVPEGFRYGIRNRGHILVKDCHLEISTEGSALLRGAWEFDNCHVRAKGNAEGSIVHLKAEPTFKGCSITSPQHTVWKSVDAEYFLQDADGNNVTDWVTIEPTTIYDLKIAGTEVTSANCNDLSVIDGVSGTVTYDPDTKTLTLDNATIKTTDIKSWGHCISNQIDGLNIHLIGNNAFSSEQSGLIYNDDDKQMTFTGEGKLTLSSGLTVPEGFRYGIRNRGHILVKNCHLEISTEGSALLRGAWEFDNCHVRAKGNAEGSIVHLKAEPTFKECSITRPQNTVWKSVDAEYFLQDADGKNVTDWVEISTKPTSAQALRTDAPTRCGIFTLTGVRLDTSFNRLPAGVYIVDGKKMVKP